MAEIDSNPDLTITDDGHFLFTTRAKAVINAVLELCSLGAGIRALNPNMDEYETLVKTLSARVTSLSGLALSALTDANDPTEELVQAMDL